MAKRPIGFIAYLSMAYGLAAMTNNWFEVCLLAAFCGLPAGSTLLSSLVAHERPAALAVCQQCWLSWLCWQGMRLGYIIYSIFDFTR